MNNNDLISVQEWRNTLEINFGDATNFFEGFTRSLDFSIKQLKEGRFIVFRNTSSGVFEVIARDLEVINVCGMVIDPREEEPITVDFLCLGSNFKTLQEAQDTLDLYNSIIQDITVIDPVERAIQIFQAVQQ